MNSIIPIFTSHGSIGRSILTLENEHDITECQPVSIIAIAKKYELKQIFLVEKSMNLFVQSYENCDKNKIQLNWGLRLPICQDATNKTDNSFKSQSDIIIWLRNDKGYKSLCRIYTKAFTDFFYYTGRIDYKHLQEMWDDNLSLSIPSYDSFIHNNLLLGHECIADFGKIKSRVFTSNMDLPFDNLIKNAHIKYAKTENLDIREVHPIYYYNTKSFDAYHTFRCINKRSTIYDPKLDHFSSKSFSWEKYQEKTK